MQLGMLLRVFLATKYCERISSAWPGRALHLPMVCPSTSVTESAGWLGVCQISLVIDAGFVGSHHARLTHR
jgi:hypothetical protein